MTSAFTTGVFGFRFKVPTNMAMCELFAIGREEVRHTSYEWDGLQRNDGPLLLFQYTLEGEGIFESDSETRRIEAGRAFMTEIPGNHRYYFPEGGSRWSFIFVLLRPTLILPNWMDAKRRLGCAPYLPSTSRPIRVLEHIIDEAYAGRITEPYSASSFMYHFVAELCRFASVPNERTEWPEKIGEAIAFIDSHYDRMISLEELSERLGISKYHLLRKFTAAVGNSPNDYLNRVRVEHAMRLLRQTDSSVEEIAERVGYSSGSYFIKVFRKVTGHTPGHFRSYHGKLEFSRIFFD